MKNLLITLFLVVATFYLLGEIADQFFVFHSHDFDYENPLIGGLIFCGVAGLLVLLGFCIAVSLFAALMLGLGAALVGVLFVGLHLFWPILFLFLIFYVVFDNKKSA